MYDLTVDDAHTFAVGAGAWVVHNCTVRYVDYNDAGLSGIARNYRRSNPSYGFGKNVVVYEWIDDSGILISEAFPMKTPYNMTGPGDYTFHAEQWGWTQLEARGISPHQVTGIYTEIKPCTGTSGSCDLFLDTLFPDVEVQYTFDDGTALRNAIIKDHQMPGGGSNLQFGE